MIQRLLYRFEKGEFYSVTLRRIFKHYYKVEIGMYSHGGCFSVGRFERYTTVGRYCSIAAGVKVFSRNHPMEFKSMHAFFFNPNLKYCSEDLGKDMPTKIGNDVWIGNSAIIMPNVTEIGNGAVIGAGAVVNKNIPPYAVVVGNPARIVRYRFSKEVIEELLKSRWWEKSIEELKPDIKEYCKPYADNEKLGLS